MMQDIDFLPASYRQVRWNRRRTRWRGIVLAAFLLLTVAGAAGQYERIRMLKVQRDRLQKQAEDMQAKLESPEQLREQIRKLDVEAEIRARLRSRIAPTRVMVEVAQSLPENVTLTDFRTTSETIPKSSRRRGADPSGTPTVSGSSKPSADKATKTPYEKDLEVLKRADEELARVVWISGVAPDDLTVSTFLTALQDTKLFDDVRLLFTDTHQYQEHRLRRFSIRLNLRRVGA